MRWALRHKILSAIAVAFLLLAFLATLGALIGSPPTTTAVSSPTSRASSAAPPPATTPPPATPAPLPAPTATAVPSFSEPASTAPAPTADPDAEGASAWIDKTKDNTHSVQVAVQSVQAGITLIQQGNTDPGSQAALSGLVKQSHDFLHDAALGLVNEIDDPLKSQREEAWYAASQLSDAMSKLRSYIDSSKPSDLADFQTQYQQGVQYWNEAVAKIWSTAGRPAPPTV